jgi:hypothetical protein
MMSHHASYPTPAKMDGDEDENCACPPGSWTISVRTRNSFPIDMDHNSIRARLTFSFMAETYELDSIIDLDRHIGDSGEEPNFFLLLAKASGIDPYSYLYEVLESHEIVFSEPTGIAALSCHDGQFDWRQFEQHRREDRAVHAIREIAERTLGMRDLDQHAQLKAALLAAYRAGKDA